MLTALAGGGIEQKGKRTHGHGQQCGDCWGEEGIRGLKGNGKNTLKIFKKIKHKGMSNKKFYLQINACRNPRV